MQTTRAALSTLGNAFRDGLELKSPETISDASTEVLCAALAHLDDIDIQGDKRLRLASARLMHALLVILSVRHIEGGAH